MRRAPSPLLIQTHQSTDGLIPVIQVFQELGLEPDKKATWAAGAAVRDRWIAEFGYAPPKDNRRKVSGKGSHCMALYPPSWRPIIEEIALTYAAGPAKQADLFIEPAIFDWRPEQDGTDAEEGPEHEPDPGAPAARA